MDFSFLVQKKAAKAVWGSLLSLPAVLLWPAMAFAGEANLVLPQLDQYQHNLLVIGILVSILGMLFGLYQYKKVEKFDAHQSMLDVAHTIYETCKTYLIQQGKFLILLFAFIAFCIAFYYGFLQQMQISGYYIF